MRWWLATRTPCARDACKLTTSTSRPPGGECCRLALRKPGGQVGGQAVSDRHPQRELVISQNASCGSRLLAVNSILADSTPPAMFLGSGAARSGAVLSVEKRRSCALTTGRLPLRIEIRHALPPRE